MTDERQTIIDDLTELRDACKVSGRNDRIDLVSGLDEALRMIKGRQGNEGQLSLKGVT